MKHENLDRLSILVAVAAVAAAIGVMSLTGRLETHETCSHPDPGSFSHQEDSCIVVSDSVMRVLSVNSPQDSTVLRRKSSFLNPGELSSDTFRTLVSKMLSTVKAPEYDGVGIAAPQVGILRRVIAVCRVDKDGAPFEVYPNVQIDSLFGEIRTGMEGCLSIPGIRGRVPRYSSVIVSYDDPETLSRERDTVSGFASVIFQHECDHLDGILYTDKADSLFSVGPDSR